MRKHVAPLVFFLPVPLPCVADGQGQDEQGGQDVGDVLHRGLRTNWGGDGSSACWFCRPINKFNVAAPVAKPVRFWGRVRKLQGRWILGFPIPVMPKQKTYKF